MGFLASEVPVSAPSGAPVFPLATSAPEVAEALAAGDTDQLLTKFNRHARRLDTVSRATVGGYAVLHGLTLSAGSGLLLQVANGLALIDGIVTFQSVSPIAVAASQSRIWVWAKQDGTIAVTLTSTPPAGKVLYIGSCVTSGSAVTSVDMGGVIYSLGGVRYRTTTDPDLPSDTPSNSTGIFTCTSSGVWFSNGVIYSKLASRFSSVPMWIKVTVPFGSIQTAGLTNTIDLTALALPAGAVVHAAKMVVGSAFAGASISALTFDLGITGTLTQFLTGLNGLATGRATTATAFFASESGSTTVKFTATATGANLSALSSGSVVVQMLISVP